MGTKIVNLKSSIANQPHSRFVWVQIVIGIAFFIQIVVSYPLWLTTARTFPFVPIIGNSTFGAADLVHILLFGLTIIGAIVSIFFHKKKIVLNAFIGILFLMMVLDATRIQAWSYQYFWMLIVLSLFSNIKKVEKKPSPPKKKANSKTSKKRKREAKKAKTSNPPIFIKKTIPTEAVKTYPYFLLALQFVMIFTYFWSGIHKFNIYFNKDVFPWMLSAYSFFDPIGNMPNIGYVAATVEMLLGIGLLFHKTRPITIWCVTLFHMMIIFLLVGLKWNSVVWTWNVAMIALLWILFSNHPIFKGNANISVNTLLRLSKYLPRAILAIVSIVLLFGIAPSTNFFRWWDEQVSLKMYAGDSSSAEFYIWNKDADCFPTTLKEKIKEGLHEQELRLDMDDWAFKELKVPAYGGDWAYKRAGYEFCKCLSYPEYAGIEIFKVERWSDDTDLKIYPCNKLKRMFESH